MKKLWLLLSLIAWVFISCLMLTQTTQATQGSQTAQATFSDCDQVFTGILRYHSGDTRFFDEFSAWDHDRRITRFDVNFFEPYDYNNGGNPEFDWTDYIRQAKGKVSKWQTMRIIQASWENAWYYVDALPPKRLYNNLWIQYIVQYASNSDKTPVETHKECKYYAISWCGDGILDREYGETCDPKAEPWISNNACDPVTCKETAKCNSSYNWQTVTSLVEWSYLCEVWSVSDFVYDEITHMWTWKCQNKAGTPVECYAKKPYKGKLNVKKELLGTQYVTSEWEELRWQIKVTAEWWDVNNVVIKDKLPKTSDWRWVLSYVNYSQNLPEGVNMNANQPERKDNGLVLERHTTWTLKSGQSIILIVTTKVEIMPDKDWYENIACARAEWLNEKCEPVPINTSWKIEVKKEVVVPADNIVTKTWESVEWKITVKAIGWDVEMKYIEDTLPDELVYDSYKKEHIPAWITIYDPENPGKVITWKTTWTLKSWEYIELRLYTKVVKMPQEQVKNIACAVPVTWWKECWTWSTTKLRIHKEVFNWTTRDKSVKLNEWEDTIIYKITFGNDGNTNVYVSLKDFLPKGVEFVSGSLVVSTNSNGWSVTNNWWWEVSYNWNNIQIEWVDVALYSGVFLRPNQSWVLTITGKIKTSQSDQQNRTNFACIYNGSGKRIDCDDAVYTIWWWGCEWSDCWPRNPSCKKMEVNGSTVTCYSNGISARFRLKCWWAIIGKSNERKTSRPFYDVSCSKEIRCEVLDSKMGSPVGQVCEDGPNESEASQQCFNVNAWNFSIHEWEIFPFYWNLRNMENWAEKNKNNYTTIDGDYRTAPEKYNNSGECESDQNWKIATDSMVCTFEIRGGNNTKLYTIEWPCLSSTSINPLESNKLLWAWYDAMLDTYCNNPKDCYFSFNPKRWSNSGLLPSAVYYIQNFWSGATVSLDGTKWEWDWDMAGNRDREANKPYWEYKIRLSGVKYLQCEDGEWKQVRNPEEFAPCESNFVLTNPYTVQKTPSGNLTASTEKLSKYKYLSGTSVFSEFVKAISTTDYESNDKVKSAMDSFIAKYQKLAVKLDTNKFWGNVSVKKVPWKDIYFIEWNATFTQTKSTIEKPFTIVQTQGDVTIKGNLKHNMMLLTNWSITFEWSCTSDQTVKWIFYAWGNLYRKDVKKNDDTTHNYWCTDGWLHVKWVLIWKGFDNLMNGSRSHLNDWFDRKNDKDGWKSVVMNWASVLIEYSPSIFSKSTMPPGAEDFTTALSIYKN